MTHNTAWRCMVRTMKDLLHNAFNTLVRCMNSEDINSPQHAEYWVCGLIDELMRADYLTEVAWNKQRAKMEYLRDCFSVAAYAYERAGLDFVDSDVLYEIYSRWLRYMNEDMSYWDEDLGVYVNELPADWRVGPYLESDHVYRSPGILSRRPAPTPAEAGDGPIHS